jgi:hypothetical protein
MYEIKPEEARLLAEFWEREPTDYSLEFKRVLNRLRIEPLAGKICILSYRDGREFALGRFGEHRGDPVLPLDGRRFAKLKEAQWELLKLRWAKHAGHPLPPELAAR